jgi:hypothetical protein
MTWLRIHELCFDSGEGRELGSLTSSSYTSRRFGLTGTAKGGSHALRQCLTCER